MTIIRRVVGGGGTGGVPDDGSVTNVKVATNAAISADKLTDGTTNKVMTSGERTKLTGVSSGANVGYSTVQDEGSGLSQRLTLNFTGSGVTATDDAANGRTVVSIPGGGSPANTVSGVFNVKTDYGAVGDGITNDRTAIQNAVNAAQTAGGGLVWFPPGHYMIGSTVSVTADGVHLLGAGKVATTLEKTGNFAMFQFLGTAGAASQHIFDCSIGGMKMLGGDHTSPLLDLVYVSRITVHDILMFGNLDTAIDTVELHDSRFVNVYVDWCGGNTSSQPAIYMRSARTTTGVGSSTDSSNQNVFIGCLVETWAGGAIRVGGGGNSNFIHSIHFYGTKIETGRVRGSAIVIDGDATNISFVDTYVYMDAFDTGYTTAIPAIDTSGSGSIRFDGAYIGVGAAVLTTGIRVAGGGSTFSNIEGGYDLGAPTSGNHIDIVGGSNFTFGQIRASNATTLVNGMGTTAQANPGMPIRAVAGVVSNASFAGSPAVGTLAVDTTNGRLYVKTASATWKSVAVT